jgi:hypothetical protein
MTSLGVATRTGDVAQVDIDAQLLPTADKFIGAWRSALRGDKTALKDMLSDSRARWENPFVSTSAELLDGLSQFSGFVQDPQLTVFTVKPAIGPKKQLVQIEYHLSFWYPMPWRPRIIIPGTALVELSASGDKVVSVEEKWDVSVGNIFLEQLLPRWWDVWHVFSSPSPEYPPSKLLAKSGKVSFVRLPQTVCCEVRWSGLAKFSGPPLLGLPGFSLFGNLKTSRPNKDVFYTVLPVEVQSGTFTCPDSGNEMKQSSWLYHVPSSLQHKILDLAKSETVFRLEDGGLDGDGDGSDEAATSRGAGANDEAEEASVTPDYVVGLEDINVMKSVTAGAQRGANITFDRTLMDLFAANEKKLYLYKMLPSRVVAQVDIKGEADSDKIAEAIKQIREVVQKEGKNIFGTDGVQLRPRDLLSSSSSDLSASSSPLLGLQLWSTKVCFNEQAQPSMAVYEMQYKDRLTKVQVELIIP